MGLGRARGLDYLETDPHVDASASASRVSRAMARRPWLPWRSSRGLRWSWSAHPAKGAPNCIAGISAKRSRTSPGSGEYHWMAGNFLKYGAAESSFGSKTAKICRWTRTN